MALSNPGFNGQEFARGGMIATKAADQYTQSNYAQNVSAQQLDELYGRPSATTVDTDRMSYEDTIVKTGITLLLVFVGAAVGWLFPILWTPGMIVGLALGLINAFKKQPSPALISAYALAQGTFLGALSGTLEAIFPGIAIQALLGTGLVAGVTLALFMSGKVRTSPKWTKILLVVMVAYAAFVIVNLVLQFTGAVEGAFGLYSMSIAGIPLGVIIGPVMILIGAYFLVSDFENVKYGVQNGAPRIYGWKAAFGIVVTLIWIYVEIIRLLAILRGSD